MKILPFNHVNIPAAQKALSRHQAVILPTDTIYGLHLPVSRENISILNALKGRPIEQPINALYCDVSQITTDVNNPSELQALVHFQNLPHTTVIISSSESDLGQGYRHINKAPHPTLAKVIRETGALLSTSANLTNIPYVQNFDVICETFANCITLAMPAILPKHIVDIDFLTPLASTVIDIRNQKLQLIREGVVPFKIIQTHYQKLF